MEVISKYMEEVSQVMEEEDKKPLLSISTTEFTEQIESDTRIRRLQTREGGDHSYNGIMFDMAVQGRESVIILGFVVAGELGPVKIYTKKGPHTDENKNWNIVFSDTVHGSIDYFTTLPLRTPVAIHFQEEQAFYIHSETHHDRGLVYQGYWHKQSLVAHDKNIVMHSGRSRLGSEPFTYGVWRYNRGFSGTVIYKTIPKIWSKKTHGEFPLSFKRVVLLLLMAQSNPDCIFYFLPQEIIYKILQFMEWDSFEGLEEDIFLEKNCCCILM